MYFEWCFGTFVPSADGGPIVAKQGPANHGDDDTPITCRATTVLPTRQRFRNQWGKAVQNVMEAWRCQHCGRKGRFAMSVSGLREAKIRELGSPRLPAHTGRRTRS